MRRIDEVMRKVIGSAIASDLEDPRIGFVTVTSVKTSPDLRHARVYIVPLGGGDAKPILEGLKRVKPFLRRELASRLTMRFIPDLIFAADTTFDEAERIARLLHKPEVARDLSFAPADSMNTGEEE